MSQWKHWAIALFWKYDSVWRTWWWVWKIFLKKEEGGHKSTIGFGRWKNPVCAWFVSLSSLSTPGPSYSPTRPITSLCLGYEGVLGGITLHGENLHDINKDNVLLNTTLHVSMFFLNLISLQLVMRTQWIKQEKQTDNQFKIFEIGLLSYN